MTELHTTGAALLVALSSWALTGAPSQDKESEMTQDRNSQDDTPRDEVLRWRHVIEELRVSQGLDPSRYPVEVILAIIHRESGGDPYARKVLHSKQPSQFWGLMQMGTTAALDVGFVPKLHARRETASSLHGDGERAIWYALRLMERYRERHTGEAWSIAVLWKGGARTAQHVRMWVRGGMSRDLAIKRAGVDGLAAYVADIEVLAPLYAAELERLSARERARMAAAARRAAKKRQEEEQAAREAAAAEQADAPQEGT